MASTEQNTLEDIAEIIALFSEGERVLGSKKKFKEAVSKLIVSSQVTIKNYEALINYILDCIIHEWRSDKIKKEDLLKSNNRGEPMLAKKMAIILIKQQIDISNHELSKFFGTNTRQTIYDVMKEYSELDKNHPNDSIFIERYDRLQLKISQFIKKIK